MKTIELKWIEDDNHVVAEDAFTGLKELIETGVFPNLKVKCEDDTLFITGEKEDLDKAVAKIQKDYLKYGQIAIKENLEKATAMCIESFDDNVRDIFEHTLNEYNDFKNNTNGNKPVDYVTKLGQFQFKFNKFKQVANTKHDKDIIQGFLTEIGNLSEQAEIRSKIKPVKRKINEDSLDDFIPGTTLDSSKKYFIMEAYYGNGLDEQDLKNAITNSNVCMFSIHNEYKYFKIVVKNEYNKIKKVLKNLISFGERKTWGISFTCSDDMYATVGMFSREISNDLWYDGDIDKIMRILTKNGSIYPAKMKVRKPRDPNKGYKKPEYINPDMKGGTYFDGDTQVYEMPEENESYKKLYKKLIIDQLSKLENWGMIEEKAYDDRPRKIKSRAELVRKALKQNATEITEYEELLAIKESQLMNELAYSMDINGNKTGAIWVGDRDGKFYYCTNQGILIRT